MTLKRNLIHVLLIPNYRMNKYKLFHKWSPLVSVFNTKPSHKLNLNSFTKNQGLFDIPALDSHEGFYALKELCIYQTNKLMVEAIDKKRTRKMVEIFDELSDTLCKVADLAEFVRIAHPSAAYSKAAESACITVSSIVEKLNTNRELYTALKYVVDNEDLTATTDVDKHVAKLFLFDFEQCGIHLPEADRCRVVELNDAILHLGQHFVSGASNPRTVKKSVLPENSRHLFHGDGDNFLISGLHADSSDPVVRQFAYRVFLHPDEHQEYLLMQLLSCRNQLAQICGFQTYSERALKGSLAETPKLVNSLLDMLTEALRPRANEDFKEMSRMKSIECGPNVGKLAGWDVPYFSHKIKRDVFRISTNEYAPYFSLGVCMDGLDNLMQSLYGISLVNVDVSVGECWIPEVYKLAVMHETEGLLGYIYCDFYERSGKPNQDCHFTIQGGKELADGSYQLPIVVLMLNLAVPRWSSPSLLSPSMVDNLFHEMGHAMHSMLARTKYQHVTGTRCSTDFAEVPSVLMEYFAGDPRVLSTFARHFQTGEPMPEGMLKRLCASKHLFAASEMQLQVFYSALDQIYHGSYPLLSDTTTVLAEAQTRYYSVPYVPNTSWQLRFTHLVGYGAKYYSYLMSRAVASWIWQTHFQNDPLSRQQGDSYRHGCLAHGGGKSPRQLITDFLQRQVTPSKLVDSLIHEIDDKTAQVRNMRTQT